MLGRPSGAWCRSRWSERRRGARPEPPARLERRSPAHPHRRATPTASCGASRVRRAVSCATSTRVGSSSGARTSRRGRDGRPPTWCGTCTGPRRRWSARWPSSPRRHGTPLRARRAAWWRARRDAVLSRWREVVVHHGDLGLGAVPLPPELVDAWLPRELPHLARAHGPRPTPDLDHRPGRPARAGGLVAAATALVPLRRDERVAGPVGRHAVGRGRARDAGQGVAVVDEGAGAPGRPVPAEHPADGVDGAAERRRRARDGREPRSVGPGQGGSVAMEAGGEKPRPFQVRTLPLLSTRTQKAAEGHDTALS